MDFTYKLYPTQEHHNVKKNQDRAVAFVNSSHHLKMEITTTKLDIMTVENAPSSQTKIGDLEIEQKTNWSQYKKIYGSTQSSHIIAD